MRTTVSIHPEGNRTLSLIAGGSNGHTWIKVCDQGDDTPLAPTIFATGFSLEQVQLACAAFNAALAGQTEGYLAPTQPELPQAAQ